MRAIPEQSEPGVRITIEFSPSELDTLLAAIGAAGLYLDHVQGLEHVDTKKITALTIEGMGVWGSVFRELAIISKAYLKERSIQPS